MAQAASHVGKILWSYLAWKIKTLTLWKTLTLNISQLIEVKPKAAAGQFAKQFPLAAKQISTKRELEAGNQIASKLLVLYILDSLTGAGSLDSSFGWLLWNCKHFSTDWPDALHTRYGTATMHYVLDLAYPPLIELILIRNDCIVVHRLILRPSGRFMLTESQRFMTGPTFCWNVVVWNDVSIFDRRWSDALHGVSYGPNAVCVIYWFSTSAIDLILVIFPHMLFHFSRKAKELRRFAGNMMAMRAVLAACAILLKSMDPNKLRNYLQ